MGKIIFNSNPQKSHHTLNIKQDKYIKRHKRLKLFTIALVLITILQTGIIIYGIHKHF
jgi:uncharacterized membrane-anchored protein